MQSVPRFDGTALAIQNYGCSGTLLIQSLFDGHPQVLNVPALYTNLIYQWWARNNHRSPSELIDQFLDDHPHWFDGKLVQKDLGLHQMGESQSEAIEIDREKFAYFFRKYEPYLSDSRSLIEAVYFSYDYALNGERQIPAKILLFPIHCQPDSTAYCLLADFRKLKILHMVRDPDRDFISSVRHFRSHEEGSYLNHVDAAMAQIYCDFTVHCGNAPAHGIEPYMSSELAQSFAVRLEDLHLSGRAVLQEICRWLEIDWNEILLQSTFNKKKWWNRPESKRQSGLGIKVLQHNQNEFVNRFDLWRLRALRVDIKQNWHYASPKRVHRWIHLLLALVPFKLEFRPWPERKRRLFRIICDLHQSFPWWFRALVQYDAVADSREPDSKLPRWRYILAVASLHLFDYCRVRRWMWMALLTPNQSVPMVNLLYDPQRIPGLEAR